MQDDRIAGIPEETLLSFSQRVWKRIQNVKTAISMKYCKKTNTRDLSTRELQQQKV